MKLCSCCTSQQKEQSFQQPAAMLRGDVLWPPISSGESESGAAVFTIAQPLI